jgi:hypothetical protein
MGVGAKELGLVSCGAIDLLEALLTTRLDFILPED